MDALTCVQSHTRSILSSVHECRYQYQLTYRVRLQELDAQTSGSHARSTIEQLDYHYILE